MKIKEYREQYPGLYYFDTFTFTTLGTSGSRGPDASKGYANAPWRDGDFSIQDGQQYWTVPANGIYQITAAGAYGASPGRVVSGQVNLNEGQQLKMLIGQRPISTYAGGGTFVLSDKLLIVASGGDGSGGHAAIFSPYGSGKGSNGAGYLTDGLQTDSSYQFISPKSYINGGFGNRVLVNSTEAGFGGGNLIGAGGYTGSPGDGVSGATCYADTSVQNFTDLGAASNTAGYVTVSLLDPKPLAKIWSWAPNAIDTTPKNPTLAVSWFEDTFLSSSGISTDGFNWNCLSIVDISLGKQPVNQVTYISYSPILQIYVGTYTTGIDSGVLYIKYSYDKLTWTTSYSQNINAPPMCGKVIWVDEFEKFYVRTTSNILSSTDGTNWTTSLQYIPSFSTSYSLVYAPGIIVSDMVYSTDGLTWNSNSKQFYAIAYSKKLGLFVASTSNPSSTYHLQYSYDGYTWLTSGIDIIQFNGNWTSIIWSDKREMFSMFGTNNDTQMVYSAYSYDGIHWSVHSLPTIEGPGIFETAYSPSLDLYIAISFPDYFISIEGKYWTKQGSRFTLPEVIAWSPQLDIFVCRSSTTQALSNSKDGINWTLILKRAFCTVTYSNELNIFVALEYFNGNIWYSYDGTHFTDTMFTKPTNAQAVIWSKELGLFCSGFAYSKDGKQWISSVIEPYNNSIVASIGWSPNLKILTALTENANVYYSVDGKNWTFSTNVTSSAGFNAQNIAWASSLGKFFAISTINKIYYSTNGKNWNYSSTVNTNSTFILWIPEISMLALEQNYSYDGINWISFPTILFSPALWVPEKKRILCSTGYSEVQETF